MTTEQAAELIKLMESMRVALSIMMLCAVGMYTLKIMDRWKKKP